MEYMKLSLSLKFKEISYINRIREILDLLIEITYLSGIFFIPLWFAYLFPTYHIFEFNKFVIFKIIVLLLFFFTALKLIYYYNEYKIVLRRLAWQYWLYPALFILGLCFILPSSINPAISFYGTMERQMGLIFYLYVFFWFILISFNLLTIDNHSKKNADNLDKRITRVLITLTIAATLVSVYGILQRLNIDFLAWPEPAFITNRVFSTFGQPNFLASWLLLAIPIGIWLYLRSKTFQLKCVYLFSLLVQFICLILTGSRGGIISFFFISVIFIFFYLKSRQQAIGRKILIIAGVLIVFIVLFGIINIVLPGRITAMHNLKSGSVGARFSLYSSVIEAIGERPLFGYGLETGREVLIKYYNNDWAVYNNVGQLADKAHNLILDILLAVGFFGLCLFGAFYYNFFNLVKRNNGFKSSSLSFYLCFGAAAYLSSLFFSFAVTSTDIYFWLFLALLVVINVNNSQDFSISHIYRLIGLLFGKISTTFVSLFSKNIKIFLKLFFSLLVFLVIYWQVLNIFRSVIADYYFNKLSFLLLEQDYFTALLIDDYLLEQKTNKIGQTVYEAYLGEKLSESYPGIVDLASKKIVRERLDASESLLPSSGYLSLLVKAKINDSLRRYASAQDYLNQLIDLAPHWPIVYLEQGKVFSNQGDAKQAIISYNMALLNLPSVDDIRLNEPHRKSIEYYRYLIYREMAGIYEKDSKYAAAENYYKLAYQNNFDDFGLLKKIADTYYLRGDFEKAIAYIKQGIRRSPEDYKWYLSLGVLYLESGNKEVGVQFLEKALQLNQNNQELINLLLKYKK